MQQTKAELKHQNVTFTKLGTIKGMRSADGTNYGTVSEFMGPRHKHCVVYELILMPVATGVLSKYNGRNASFKPLR